MKFNTAVFISTWLASAVTTTLGKYIIVPQPLLPNNNYINYNGP